MPTGVYEHKPLSEETKKKIGDAHRGKKRSRGARRNIARGKMGAKNPMFGKKPSEEYRRKLSDALKRYWGPRKDVQRAKFIERLRHSLEYKFWREAVYKRDKYACVLCGDDRGGNLEADHIKPFVRIIEEYAVRDWKSAMNCGELWDIINGRTLCKSCHRRTPTWGTVSRAGLNVSWR